MHGLKWRFVILALCYLVPLSAYPETKAFTYDIDLGAVLDEGLKPAVSAPAIESKLNVQIETAEPNRVVATAIGFQGKEIKFTKTTGKRPQNLRLKFKP